MQSTNDSDSRSPPQSGGVVNRAPTGALNNTAQPSLTSGFGAVLEKEHDLQTATEGSSRFLSGHQAREIDRILHHQHSRLGANIALLEQRYEALPNPQRFVNWNDLSRPPTKPRRTQSNEAELLSDLIARHTDLLASIEALIGCAPDGQRGELILTEVSRSHQQMAWRLTALLKEDEAVARLANDPGGQAPRSTTQAQENWENEGGPVGVNPRAN